MFTTGTYVDGSGALRDAEGNDTGFAVEDDGRIYSTDGANDTVDAFIDATGQVFHGDSTPMQGVSVTIGGWPQGGQLQTLPLLEQYLGEDETAASFDREQMRAKLPAESSQWTTEYDAAETNSVRPHDIENGLLVDETGNPMTGTFGYVLDPNGQLFTFSEEMWVNQDGAWIDLGLLGDREVAIAVLEVAVNQGDAIKAIHHSTAVAGGPVAGAGTLKVQAGQIVEMDDMSGHYKPQAEHLLQTVEWLRKQGMPVDQINLKDLNQQKLAQQIYDEWLAQQPDEVNIGYVGNPGYAAADDASDTDT